MLAFLVGLHNLLRWVVLLGGVAAVALALRGLLTRAPWTAGVQRAGLVFTSALGLQLLVGLVLYLPWLRSGSGITPLIDGRVRIVEHVFTMFLAVVVAQLGYSLSKRADSDRARYLRASVGYVVAALLIVWAIPWGESLIPWG